MLSPDANKLLRPYRKGEIFDVNLLIDLDDITHFRFDQLLATDVHGRQLSLRVFSRGSIKTSPWREGVISMLIEDVCFRETGKYDLILRYRLCVQGEGFSESWSRPATVSTRVRIIGENEDDDGGRPAQGSRICHTDGL